MSIGSAYAVLVGHSAVSMAVHRNEGGVTALLNFQPVTQDLSNASELGVGSFMTCTPVLGV